MGFFPLFHEDVHKQNPRCRCVLYSKGQSVIMGDVECQKRHPCLCSSPGMLKMIFQIATECGESYRPCFCLLYFKLWQFPTLLSKTTSSFSPASEDPHPTPPPPSPSSLRELLVKEKIGKACTVDGSLFSNL